VLIWSDEYGRALRKKCDQLTSLEKQIKGRAELGQMRITANVNRTTARIDQKVARID
jgi:hypothetical protein